MALSRSIILVLLLSASAYSFQPSSTSAWTSRTKSSFARAAISADVERAKAYLMGGPRPTAEGAPAATGLTPATIIGGNGRIGDLLASLGGGGDTIIGREDPIPADGEGPIFVCTRNDVLASIVAKTPEHRQEDLVFMQNGYLDSFLEEYGLESNTQALIYFAVSKKGEAPIDGKTDLNPDGLTAVTGKWAAAFKERIEAAGLACFDIDTEAYRVAMFEKLIWIDAFMLVGALNGGITVGEVEKIHRQEVTELIGELCSAVTLKTGTKFGPGCSERLCAYARSVAHFPTAIKEFEWRNGYFWNISEEAEDEGKPDPCPTHTAYCNKGLVEDIFSF